MDKRFLTICGACISFYIGAGFATMQEVVQYEASYGSMFPIAIAAAGIIYIYIYKYIFLNQWKSIEY